MPAAWRPLPQDPDNPKAPGPPGPCVSRRWLVRFSGLCTAGAQNLAQAGEVLGVGMRDKVVLAVEEEGEVLAAYCGLGMLRAQHLLLDCQRALEERSRRHRADGTFERVPCLRPT